MEFLEVVNGRRSIRGYLDKPVEKEVLEEVLNNARRAVSANNIQPWHFAIVTGEPLARMREENLRRFRAGDDVDYEDAPDGSYGDAYKNRLRTVGKALFEKMDIKREDKERRAWWIERGFGFFDAPAVILLYMEGHLDEAAYRFDLGCVAQNITLCAYEKGLGTCVANQAINFHKHYYKELGIPETSRFVVGIPIGYPDPDFKANEVISERADLSENTTWVGFD